MPPRSSPSRGPRPCCVAGGLVAFPTETVYGLGANALDAAAVRRNFEAKGRPAHNPVIVHVATPAEAMQVAVEWPANAARLAERFWPGPLTLVLPKKTAVPDVVTGGGPTVAVRAGETRWPAPSEGRRRAGGGPDRQPFVAALPHASRPRPARPGGPSSTSCWTAAPSGRHRIDGPRPYLRAAAPAAPGAGEPGRAGGDPRSRRPYLK